jgi:hypothetical protein
MEKIDNQPVKVILKTAKNNSKLIICLFISLFISMPCFSQTEEGKEKLAPASQLTSLQKSLLIPGWGQIAEKKYAEGLLFLSAEIFCFYNIFFYNHKGNFYYDKYKKADNVSDAVKYRELTENYDTKRNKFLLAAASVWVINLIDTYIIVKNKEKKRRNINLKLEHNENKSLSFTISFSF